MPHLLVIIIIGAIAGWIAGALVDADNSSILVDILIGIVGGYIGNRLFGGMLNFTDNVYVNDVITSTAGAVILAFIIKLIRRGGRTRD
ncbi:MAG: GlsB/YeaQ/YmgE family stress response rane protein [Flavipsychrobacter sp.]|nr:GlsB/YeaQ/YmgE family stress response rane protein [Flavipsychrobacter sp.]